jgi:hypothetical protein
MEELVAKMLSENPGPLQQDPQNHNRLVGRPTIDQVVAEFSDIRRNLSSWQLRSRVTPDYENGMVGFVKSAFHWANQLRLMVTNIPAIPSLP